VIQLQWDSNVELDLAGYRVYSGTQTRAYGTPTDVGKVNSYALTALAAGEYFVAVTAYNAAGIESGYSNEVSVTVAPQATITQLGVSYLTATTAAISWVTSIECSGEVAWGTAANTLDKKSTGNNLATTDHMVLLSGLPARTHLYYRASGVCQGATIRSELRSFNSK
jgi:hypothetical protein